MSSIPGGRCPGCGEYRYTELRTRWSEDEGPYEVHVWFPHYKCDGEHEAKPLEVAADPGEVI